MYSCIISTFCIIFWIFTFHLIFFFCKLRLAWPQPPTRSRGGCTTANGCRWVLIRKSLCMNACSFFMQVPFREIQFLEHLWVLERLSFSLTAREFLTRHLRTRSTLATQITPYEPYWLFCLGTSQDISLLGSTYVNKLWCDKSCDTHTPIDQFLWPLKVVIIFRRKFAPGGQQ